MENFLKMHAFVKVAEAKKKQVKNYERRISNLCKSNIDQYMHILRKKEKTFGNYQLISFKTLLTSEKRNKIYPGSIAEDFNILGKREKEDILFYYKLINITNRCVKEGKSYKILNDYIKRNKQKWNGLCKKYGKHEIFVKQKDLLASKEDPNNWRPLIMVNNNLLFICILLASQISMIKTPKNFLNFNINHKKSNKKAVTGFEPFISCSHYAVKHKNQKHDFIQLDLSKAFDNVDWQILEKILPLYLDSDFSEIILNIIKETKFTYGNAIIQRKKGIAQGIPFSPIIFGIIMYSINTVLVHELRKPPLRLKKNIDYINNLWVDDIVFYFKTQKSKKHSKSIFKIMERIYNDFGFSINMKKSWKSSDNIDINIRNIKPDDQYLGLYFSKNFKENIDLINKYLSKRFEADKEIIKWIGSKEISLESIEKNMDSLTKSNSVKIFGCLNYYFCGLLLKKFPTEKKVKKKLASLGYKKISEKVTILQKNI